VGCAWSFEHFIQSGSANKERKKAKISKAEKKKMLTEKAKKASEKRGVGAGSRRKFELEANWTEEHYKSGDKTRVRFVSPGKKRYKTQKQVAETLVVRNLGDCLHEKSSTSEEDNSEGSDYDPSDEKKAANSDSKVSVHVCKSNGLEVECRLFVCESMQLMDMVKQINATSKCPTPDCNGGFIFPFNCHS